MSLDGQHLEPFVDALKRMGGMYGSVWVNGVMQTDVIELKPTIEIQRQTIMLVGNQSEGYKPTRATRSATLGTQKIDSRWNIFIYNQLSQSLDNRRWWRDNPGGNPANAPGGSAPPPSEFSLKLAIDDPDAYGYEAWQLDRCKIWRMELGSAQTDDHIETQYPLTWTSETPLSTFSVTAGQVTGQNQTPAPVVVYSTGKAPYS
jgi:hypothetical protein